MGRREVVCGEGWVSSEGMNGVTCRRGGLLCLCVHLNQLGTAVVCSSGLQIFVWVGMVLMLCG